MNLSEVVLLLEEDVDLVIFYGQNDENINAVRKAYPDITITSRGGMMKITGEKSRVQEVKGKLEMMSKVLLEYKEITKRSLHEILSGENPFAARVKKKPKTLSFMGAMANLLSHVPKTKKRW